MSTEPLLPSYASATGWQQSQTRCHHGTSTKNVIISAAPVIQKLNAVICTGTAIVFTVWARQTTTTPEPAPPVSAPLLPYFALLFLVISFSCWVGYLIFIFYDAAGGPKLQRKIVIWTSVAGKIVWAGTHAGVWLWYRTFFPGLSHPNWVLVFLAVQAWWDFLLVVVYSRLRGVGQAVPMRSSRRG